MVNAKRAEMAAVRAEWEAELVCDIKEKLCSLCYVALDYDQ